MKLSGSPVYIVEGHVAGTWIQVLVTEDLNIALQALASAEANYKQARIQSTIQITVTIAQTKVGHA